MRGGKGSEGVYWDNGQWDNWDNGPEPEELKEAM